MKYICSEFGYIEFYAEELKNISLNIVIYLLYCIRVLINGYNT